MQIYIVFSRKKLFCGYQTLKFNKKRKNTLAFVRKIWYHIWDNKNEKEFTMASGCNSAFDITALAPLLIFGVFILFMYFFMLRPQKKQERETNDMRNNLKVGDEITTIGGIIGKIISIKEETVMIETGHDRTRIRILKSAVRNVDVHAEDAQD